MKKKCLPLILLLFLMFIPGVFAQIVYLPSSIETIEGTYTDGDLGSVIVEHDHDWYNVTESVGVPAFDIRINFSDVLLPFDYLTARVSYSGTEGHIVKACLWNYTSEAWNCFIRFYDEDRLRQEHSIIPNYQHHVSGGLVQMRIHNDQAGNTNHEIFIDFVSLELAYTPASKGEFVAAALVASLILVPLLILLIFAARRKW